MEAYDYLNFDIKIERSGEKFRAEVLDSPGGQAAAEFKRPFSKLELENFFLRLGQPRQNVRRIESYGMETAKDFGERLFRAVFKDDVYACFVQSAEAANRQGKGLRLRLRVNAPEFLDLPWEFLYNPNLNQFLSLSTATPVVRYIELFKSIEALTIQPPLKILAMISSPAGYPALDVEKEWEQLQNALAPLLERGLVTLERLEKPTLGELQKRLRQDEFHIFHFIGHGQFIERAQDGKLLLEDENGRGNPVSGQYLGTLLHDERSIRLVVLNACEGARTSPEDQFSGVAQTLVQQGIPAVIAMQFEITERAALSFSQEFYAALADGYPLDAALGEARKAIFASENDVEWGTPVLFTRAADGRIFNIAAEAVASARPAARAKPASKPRLPKLKWKLVAAILAAVMVVGAAIGLAVNWKRWFPSSSGSPEVMPDAKGVPMVYIPAGQFSMGTVKGENSQPVHLVFLDAFYIDQCEVTNRMWAFCVEEGQCVTPIEMGSNQREKYYEDANYGNYPVLFVTWEMAQAYCTWRGARLPTEAEWEKAARGGLKEADYPWGDAQPACKSDAAQGANFSSCEVNDTQQVGSFPPNGFGLYDMAGNVMEWVADWYAADYYSAGESQNPPGPDTGTTRVLRGGSWDGLNTDLNVAARWNEQPLYYSYTIGFRCARSTEP